MPIYEYKCKDCENEFEELVFSHDECPPCPACKSGATEKLISACRTRMGSGEDFGGETESAPAAASAPSGCAGCVGGNCSSCG
ncbi:FmdB family zinc ribbon protein [Desulfovibrio oxyclinae]|jgi:putative FmdB family regulatory protein|uniref:FmdB family zinc ribbon protein n=1 Tax=Desulfovibrio oxyclinae TaxID=63560 RepID=UPI000381C0DF|nr:zinc ribbon domain-containing protein [Desulfovibrio oxyclinae]